MYKKIINLLDYRFNLIYIMSLIFFFTAPFSMSTYFKNLIPVVPTSILILLVFSLFAVIGWIQKDKVVVTYETKTILFLFFTPIFVSLLPMLYNLLALNTNAYNQYVSQEVVGRMINVSIFIILFITLMYLVNKLPFDNLSLFVKAYLFGIAILIFFGFWEWFHNVFNVPYLNIRTRSNVHSVDVSMKLLFTQRLTSIVDEPSYLVPFLIDFIIIGIAIASSKKKYVFYYLLPALFILIFTFAVSGYANLLLISFFAFFISFKTIRKNVMKLLYQKRSVVIGSIIGIIAVFLVILVKVDFFIELFYPIIGRFNTLFDVTKHSRLFMVLMPFKWVFEHSFLAVLFGNGPTSYMFLSKTKTFIWGAQVHGTSNNIFTDSFYEQGLYGFLSIILLFSFLIYGSYMNWKRDKNKYTLVSFYLSLHLLVTSMYRSDYVSPRFWVMITIIIIFWKFGSTMKRETRT